MLLLFSGGTVPSKRRQRTVCCKFLSFESFRDRLFWPANPCVPKDNRERCVNPCLIRSEKELTIWCFCLGITVNQKFQLSVFLLHNALCSGDIYLVKYLVHSNVLDPYTLPNYIIHHFALIFMQLSNNWILFVHVNYRNCVWVQHIWIIINVYLNNEDMLEIAKKLLQSTVNATLSAIPWNINLLHKKSK